MKKANRELIFKKYDGRCAYCGCELQKGWHVDEVEPVRRNKKWINAGWEDGKPRPRTEADDNDPSFAKWIPGRWVADGCLHPGRFNTDNQMPACASCNINKHAGSVEDFRSLISGFMKHLNEVSTQYKIAKRYGLVVEDIKPVVFYFETITAPLLEEKR